jgi:hypothetical protein
MGLVHKSNLFCDLHPDFKRDPKSGELRSYRAVNQFRQVRVFVDDPRLKIWTSGFRGCRQPRSPVPDKALAEIKDWLFQIQEAAGNPIRRMVAEEFGSIHGHQAVGAR